MRKNLYVQSLHRIDWLWMLLGFSLCIVVSYLFGYKRIFWEDEMLGWMLLHDPSWRHMLEAWNRGADGGGFTFYATGRAWFLSFGASEVSFRFYSATCFGLAFAITWVTARHFYKVSSVAPALFAAWFLSPPLVTHLAEGRFYGLLLLTVSAVVWFTAVKTRDAETSAGIYMLAFVLNGLLTTSHVLGIIYSAVLLAALVLIDFKERRLRLGLYLVTASSWLLLWPESKAILATTQVGKPYFWTTPPDLSRFFGAYCEFSAAIAGLLVVLAVLILASRKRSVSATDISVSSPRQPAIMLVLALFTLPLLLTIESRFGTSLFINRYLMPLTIAEALLLCELFSQVRWSAVLPARKQKLLVTIPKLGSVGLAAFILFYVFSHLNHYPLQAPDFTKELTADLPKGIPVLCEDAWFFTELIGRQHASGVDYTYLLDWQQSISKSAPRLEVTQFHLMENWRKVGYFSGSIEYRDTFLREHSKFIILHPRVTPPPEGPTIGNPLAERFKSTEGYEIVPYRGKLPKGMDAWVVCRLKCST